MKVKMREVGKFVLCYACTRPKQTYYQFVLLLFVKKGDVLAQTAFSFNFQTKELLTKKDIVVCIYI